MWVFIWFLWLDKWAQSSRDSRFYCQKLVFRLYANLFWSFPSSAAFVFHQTSTSMLHLSVSPSGVLLLVRFNMYHLGEVHLRLLKRCVSLPLMFGEQLRWKYLVMMIKCGRRLKQGFGPLLKIKTFFSYETTLHENWRVEGTCDRWFTRCPAHLYLPPRYFTGKLLPLFSWCFPWAADLSLYSC